MNIKTNENHLKNLPRNFFSMLLVILTSLSLKEIFAENRDFKTKKTTPESNSRLNTEDNTLSNELEIASVNWEKFNDSSTIIPLKWIKYEDYEKKYQVPSQRVNESKIKKRISLNSLNRSIVFDNKIVGPDISWIIPSGLPWNKRYRFDFTTRGHNTKIPDPPTRNFFGWNDGDAVGLFSYQFLHTGKNSLGLNLGIRSLYEGNQAAGGSTRVGEGMSAGFRWDKALSETSGFAIGAEQLLHFDGLTDTGRNIYISTSKAWWSVKDNENKFPLYVATAGLGTGRMAVGTVRGFCSGILGGSGTETNNKRNLCWAPVFSLAKVWNYKLSTYFEYNSRFFLLGSSLAPIKNIPIRGNLGLILSDHVDNYKLHGTDKLNWVFNLSIGF
tara:strand:+ start:529 stop:1683 length:1155 start_codon:yes stop_codon:yes gene_type:complete